jgi:hypothetical protein
MIAGPPSATRRTSTSLLRLVMAYARASRNPAWSVKWMIYCCKEKLVSPSMPTSERGESVSTKCTTTLHVLTRINSGIQINAFQLTMVTKCHQYALTKVLRGNKPEVMKNSMKTQSSIPRDTIGWHIVPVNRGLCLIWTSSSRYNRFQVAEWEDYRRQEVLFQPEGC